jgi:predicted phage terminase large subunit-like protein
VRRDDFGELDALLRNDFASFLHRSMQTLNPGGRFLRNWHIDAIAHQLSNVSAGDVTRLIVNMPPRYLKSTIVSVAYPAFLLGHHPNRRIICVSYGTELSAKHASDCRAIVESPWYRRIFPKMQIARATQSEIHTTARGFRKATSVHAALTGLGGDCFIIDDPQKPVDAQSHTQRNGLNGWFSNTLLSRLDDKRTSAIIIVMQRIHLRDLTGFLTEDSNEWTVLSLPAIAETNEVIEIGDGDFHRRGAGEPLHRERESLETLEKLRTELGPEAFAAQYMQSPVPLGGSMIKREWLRYYDYLPERAYATQVIQSWDTAAKGGAQNDWSVGTTWLIDNKRYFLLDVVRGRFEYPVLRETVLASAARFQPQTILIEDASTGTALAQELRRDHSYHVELMPVHHDKVGRLYVQQPKFAAGLVSLPRHAPFRAQVELELLTFPQGKTDDIVDSIAQALSYDQPGYDRTYAAFQPDYQDPN